MASLKDSFPPSEKPYHRNLSGSLHFTCSLTRSLQSKEAHAGFLIRWLFKWYSSACSTMAPEDSYCVHPSSKRTQCLWSGYWRTKLETKWVWCCLHCLGGCLPWTALTRETFKYSISPHTRNLLQTLQLKKVNLKNAYTERNCFLSCSCV